MIWMISSMVMGSLLILAGIFINYAPPVQDIIETDFLRKVAYNARLEALNYADVCLRAQTLKPGSSVPAELTKEITNSVWTTKKGSQPTLVKQRSHVTITTDPPGATQDFDVKVTTEITTLYY